MHAPRATVKDVAREAGLSLATCVHILGGREARYAAATIRRVHEVAQRLGYRRNAQARAMRLGRTQGIAMLSPENPAYGVLPMAFLRALESSLVGRGYHLSLAQLSDAALVVEGTLPRLLREWGCDGLVVNYQLQAPAALERLIDASDLPAVWINAKRRQDCVYPEEYRAVHQATAHLIELGHRRIAWADPAHGSLNPSSHFSVHDRWDGYAAAMHDAGLIPRALVRPGEGYLEEHVHLRRAAAWVAEAPTQRPTAILSTHPDIVASCVHAWALVGLRVPQDLSLIALAAERVVVIGQPITTIHIPYRAMAEQAADTLLSRIENGRHTPPVALPMPFDSAGSIAPVSTA